MIYIFRSLSFLLFVGLFVPQQLMGESKQEFHLGVAVCLTGGCSEWGTGALRGVELAAKEINQEGGIAGQRIVVRAEDTNEAVSGAAAVRAFQSLLSRREINYIIGPSWSPAGLALIPVLKRRPDVVVITPSMAVPDFPRASANLFKTVPDNEVTARHIARYAIEKGWRRAAILSNQLEAERYTTEQFTSEFREGGGEVIELIETLAEETDLQTPALRIIQSKPDVVFLANYVQVGTAARRLRELGYEGPFISILLDTTRLAQGGSALDGTVFSQYASYSAEFEHKFRERYGEGYGPSADSAYDTVYLLREAIQQAGTFDPVKVKEVLPQIEMEGTASPIKFNEHRTVEKPPGLFIVQDQRALPLGD